jgi:hypothetical protein
MGILLNELTDEVLINLAGYTLQQDKATHLIADISTTTSTIAAPTIFSVADAQRLGAGIVEIDDELLWVDTVDRVSNTATVSPYGRGFSGSTAATHTAGSKVTISPTFPKHVVKRAIQDTIRAMGSSMFAVKQTSFTFSSTAINTYELDNKNIQNILTMHWQDIGSSKEWIRIKRWDLDSFPDVATWGSGAQTVTIGDRIVSGRKVKVVYTTVPTTLSTSSTDSFTTQTGLPESCKDIVILGASYRLIAYLDPARTGAQSPQADETDNTRTFGSATNAYRQLFALYNQRLSEETMSQQQQYPPRVHFSR